MFIFDSFTLVASDSVFIACILDILIWTTLDVGLIINMQHGHFTQVVLLSMFFVFSSNSLYG